MNIESAQYVKNDNDQNASVKCVIDGVIYAVPMDPSNRHYAEIMRQVEAGTLTIAEAE